MNRYAVLMLAGVLSGCTPQAALLASAVPDGTASVLLSHTEHVPDANRRHIVALEQRHDWAGLARFADDNIRRDPHTPDWLLVAGYAYTQQGRHDQAAERYREAVRLEPDESLGWTLLAQSYRAAGHPQRAANTLDNALLARRDDPRLFALLGDTQIDMQRWSDAISAYRDAVRLDAEYVPAWQGLQRAYAGAGRTREAQEAERMVQRLQEAPKTGRTRSR